MCSSSYVIREIVALSALQFVLLEKAPGQQWGQAVEHTGGQVEDGAEAGLQSCGATSVDHHHLVDLIWIFVSQERAERHTVERSTEDLVTGQTGTNRIILAVCLVILSLKCTVIFNLPIRMSDENISLACISLEDQSDILSQGVESVRRRYLWR